MQPQYSPVVRDQHLLEEVTMTDPTITECSKRPLSTVALVLEIALVALEVALVHGVFMNSWHSRG